MQGTTTELLLVLVLITLSAFFSATETAYTSLNRIRMRSRAEGGDRRAALALRLSEDYDRFLSTILIGDNIDIGQVFRREVRVYPHWYGSSLRKNASSGFEYLNDTLRVMDPLKFVRLRLQSSISVSTMRESEKFEK